VILKEVSGDVFDVEEIEYLVEADRESAFLLATRGNEAVGCGVGRPSSIQNSLYAMVASCRSTAGRGPGRGSTRRSPSTREL
jgi:hypothetical protein